MSSRDCSSGMPQDSIIVKRVMNTLACDLRHRYAFPHNSMKLSKKRRYTDLQVRDKKVTPRGKDFKLLVCVPIFQITLLWIDPESQRLNLKFASSNTAQPNWLTLQRAGFPSHCRHLWQWLLWSLLSAQKGLFPGWFQTFSSCGPESARSLYGKSAKTQMKFKRKHGTRSEQSKCVTLYVV